MEANRSFSPHKCYSVKLCRKHLAADSLAFNIWEWIVRKAATRPGVDVQSACQGNSWTSPEGEHAVIRWNYTLDENICGWVKTGCRKTLQGRQESHAASGTEGSGLHFRRRSHKWKFKAMPQILNGLVDGQLGHNNCHNNTWMQKHLQMIGLKHAKRNNKDCN